MTVKGLKWKLRNMPDNAKIVVQVGIINTFPKAVIISKTKKFVFLME